MTTGAAASDRVGTVARRRRWLRAVLLGAISLGLVAVFALVLRPLLAGEGRSIPVARLVHLEAAPGVSFDYPGGWIVTRPNDVSMVDAALVTVSSAPLLPPCPNDRCQRFTTPPGAIVVEFRAGGGPELPDWSRATTTLGGQPATHQVWGAGNATSADVAHQWNARLAGRMILGVYVSLRGPGLPALEAAMAQIIATVRIDPAALPQEWRE